jgi:hypothetical protein
MAARFRKTAALDFSPQSATINSPGTMGRVRGRAPRYPAKPISRSAHAKTPSFTKFDVRVRGNVFQSVRSMACDTVTAQTEL